MKFALPIGVVLLACGLLTAQHAATNSYTQTNLVSDLSGMAVSTDPHLVNPWGLSHYISASATEGQWWASDQRTGVSTLYEANGTIAPLVITVPPASGSGTGSPTGTVGFGANFAFVTLDGTISQWLSAAGPAARMGQTGLNHAGFNHAAIPAAGCTGCHTTVAAIKVNHSSEGRVYTGVTVATSGGKQQLYAAASTGVEVYDTSFNPVTLAPGAFTDPNVPAGYTPYGIQTAGSRIYVTFSPPPPATGGYVDAFNAAGTLLLTLQNGAWFDEPWGVALAPANFGAFSSALLVGNTGSGAIAAFNPKTGKFVGVLENSSGKPILNPGLWAIYFGDGNTESGPVNVLYFNAGIQNFAHGLFGSIAAN
jgi:uncharacterized protein (TIGR03118 family)